MTSADCERAGLLAAVLDDPGDDAPRLIMADWLEDHGEPERAEFIRVQCEVGVIEKGLPTEPFERLGWLSAAHQERRIIDAIGGQVGPCECLRCQLERLHLREQGLAESPSPGVRGVREWGGESLADWGHHVGAFREGLTPDFRPAVIWRRGFVAAVRLPMRALIANAELLAASCPVESVTVTDKAPTLHPGDGPVGWYVDTTRTAGDDVPERVWSSTTTLPEVIGEHLTRYDASWRWAWYDNAALATADMSVACLAHLRARRPARA